MPIPDAAATGEGLKRCYGDNARNGILADNLDLHGQCMSVREVVA
jgi:hypothetical protein